jgi:hypothetical protein
MSFGDFKSALRVEQPSWPRLPAPWLEWDVSGTSGYDFNVMRLFTFCLSLSLRLCSFALSTDLGKSGEICLCFVCLALNMKLDNIRREYMHDFCMKAKQTFQ